jgi:tRNA-2-methylthio-N6-dimethylallyladenosine synthase
MARRFYIETFGCQMNEHDSEKIAGLLSHRGMIPVHSLDEADLFLLNTCSIREKAAQKVYSRLGEVKARKISHQGFVIGVVGCVAQQEGRKLLRRAPYVDLVVGTHMYHALPDLLEETDTFRHQKVAVDLFNESPPVEIGSVLRRDAFRASVTIMEGCNKQCSFCVVPHTRGKERNREGRLILDEIRRLAAQGYVEVLLLGQTVNSYRDPANPRFRFSDLLSGVAEIPGIERVRFTSPHPRAFDQKTVQAMAAYPNICDQVHLPVQSGSTRILKKMRRQYSREWFLDLIERFDRSGRPIRFSTDVIVGFPGETEKDFEETLSLVAQVRFESMFSFKYSPRPHTESFDWADEVPEMEKSRRLASLQLLQRDIQINLHRERYLGRTFPILTEGTARDRTQRCGRTTTNKIVNFEGNDRPGTFTDVLITETGPNSLIGEKARTA